MATNVREVRPAEVADRLDAYRVIDIREASEFDGPLGHIACAEHVPQGELPGQIERLCEGLPLLLVCRSGNRSGKACARFPDAPATNLAGGMIEWNQERLPLVREPRGDPASILDTLVVWLSQVQRIDRAEAKAFVRQRLPQRPAEAPLSVADTRRAIDNVDAALRVSAAPPADLEIVCASLRSDLASLGAGGRGA